MDNTWYVNISGIAPGHYYSFTGACGESYRGFVEIARSHGFDVLAEQFGISDGTMNRITGFDRNNQRTGRNPLKELVDRINRNEVPDVQEALSKLCSED